MTHTPGNWEYRLLEADGYVITKPNYEIRTDEYDVCTYIPKSAPIRREADARLIAAAPDLLEACQAVMAWWNNEDCETVRETEKRFEKLQAAIAKATNSRKE